MQLGHEPFYEDEEDEREDDDDDDEQFTDDDDQGDDREMEKSDDDDDDDDDNLTEQLESEELHDEFDDDLLFSPAPVRSSQRMDVFSPATFTQVMEDEHTLQSTPKTTGSSKTTRIRRNILD